MAKKSLALPRQVLDWKVGPHYEIIKQLGEGSYGLVCEARHLPTGERVAIKHVTKIFDDLVDCKRLLREIVILGYLNHPNVVRMREIIRPSNLDSFNELYVVMEHAQSDLKKLVKSLDPPGGRPHPDDNLQHSGWYELHPLLQRPAQRPEASQYPDQRGLRGENLRFRPGEECGGRGEKAVLGLRLRRRAPTCKTRA